MDHKKTKEIVDLNPKNSEYAQRIASARSVSHPVGGAPMPKMPNFAQAQEAGSRHAGVQNSPQQRAQGMANLLTPEEREHLEKSGHAIPGVGSAYAFNQPAVRQAQSAGYQNPPRAEGGLTQQTAEQLEAVAKANAEPQVAQAEKESEKLKREIEDLEEELFDYDEFGNKVKSILANKERRELIESRCAPMDLMDLLINKEVRQEVPIISGKYFPTFRTMGGDEDLEVKRLIAAETTSTPSYVLAKMGLMNLTCGLYALNGKPLMNHLSKEGDFNRDLFLAKFNNIIKYPMPVLADLAVNYTWFDRRVRSLIAVDAIRDF